MHFRYLILDDDMINRAELLNLWPELVARHGLPSEPYEHQLDAMALIREKKHVFLGGYRPDFIINIMRLLRKVFLLAPVKHFHNLQPS